MHYCSSIFHTKQYDTLQYFLKSTERHSLKTLVAVSIFLMEWHWKKNYLTDMTELRVLKYHTSSPRLLSERALSSKSDKKNIKYVIVSHGQILCMANRKTLRHYLSHGSLYTESKKPRASVSAYFDRFWQNRDDMHIYRVQFLKKVMSNKVWRKFYNSIILWTYRTFNISMKCMNNI